MHHGNNNVANHRKILSTPRRGIILIFIVLMFASCKEAPLTERKQLILIPESSAMKLGEDAFKKIIRESKLSNNRDLIHQVKKVGSNLVKATNRTNYKWEFIYSTHLLDFTWIASFHRGRR